MQVWPQQNLSFAAKQLRIRFQCSQVAALVQLSRVPTPSTSTGTRAVVVRLHN